MATEPDKRRHARYPVHAFVRMQSDSASDALIFPAIDLSLGGILLQVNVGAVFKFRVGVLYQLTLFDPRDQSLAPLKLEARVVRHDPRGVAFEWGPEEADRMRTLLERLERLRL
jgi:hypothetical protein